MKLNELVEYFNAQCADIKDFEPLSSDTDSKESLLAWLDDNSAAREDAQVDKLAENLIQTDGLEFCGTCTIGGLEGVQTNQRSLDPEGAAIKLGIVVIARGDSDAIAFDLTTGKVFFGDTMAFGFEEIFENMDDPGHDELVEYMTGESEETWDSMTEFVLAAKAEIDTFE